MNRMTPLVPLILALGCGTLEQDAPITTGLPNNRTGPFRVLDLDELEGQRCALSAQDASLEEPDGIIRESGEITLVMVRAQGELREIVRATLDGRLALREAPTPVLPGVTDGRSPSLARDGRGWLLAYTREGRVEVAFSDDGLRFTRRPVPLLSADPRAGEHNGLRGASLTQAPDGTWWLAYESAGSVWIARADASEGPFTRVDADAERPGRQPVMEGSPSRQHTNPVVRVERTGTGRTIWRVYASTRRERVEDGAVARTQELSLAASWDGARFTTATTPALSGRAEPTPDAPTLLFADATRSLMLFTGGCGSAFRGVRAAVFPAEATLPITR